MSRTPDQVMDGIAGSLLPSGWAWDHDRASNTVKSFQPLADFAAAFEARAEAQLLEATPRTSEEMLPAYERVLGPDPCLGDPAVLTFGERRTSASARWITPGDASVPGLIALAASYGVAITITEVRRRPCGVLKCGQALVPHPQEFTFVVGLPAAQVVPFRMGVSKCGDPLGRIVRNTLVECVIRRAAPARTVPVFSYGAAA